MGPAPNQHAKKADENFDLHKRAQPKASDLRESVQLRPAGGPFAKWVQAQPAANRVRHHAAAKWVQAQPARLNKADEIFAQTQHREAGSWAPHETNT